MTGQLLLCATAITYQPGGRATPTLSRENLRRF
jgi:hypothetical protein